MISTEVIINDKKYTINAFHAMKAWNIFKRIGVILSSGIDLKDTSDTTFDINAIAVKILEQDHDNKLLEDIISGVLYENAPIALTAVFDKLFCTRLTDLILLIVEIVKVNYSDFFQTEFFIKAKDKFTENGKAVASEA